MANPRRGDKEIVLSESVIVQIADELERRVLRLLRPEPTPALTQAQIDPDDLMTPQNAAHRYGVSDQTVYRRMERFDISECVAGTVLVSRRKVAVHLERPGGRGIF
jgi:hypothetical protein